MDTITYPKWHIYADIAILVMNIATLVTLIHIYRFKNRKK